VLKDNAGIKRCEGVVQQCNVRVPVGLLQTKCLDFIRNVRRTCVPLLTSRQLLGSHSHSDKPGFECPSTGKMDSKQLDRSAKWLLYWRWQFWLV